MMSPWSAAIGGALISGVVMYTVGERSERLDAFTQPAPVAAPVEYVQTVDGRYIAVTPAPQAMQPVGYTNALQPAVPVAQAPVVVERVAAPRQTVYRTQPVQERVVVERAPVQKRRSWQKSALVIGGSAASGAAVGGMIDGKKGALIGAALGGGAASIYEAVKR